MGCDCLTPSLSHSSFSYYVLHEKFLHKTNLFLRSYMLRPFPCNWNACVCDNLDNVIYIVTSLWQAGISLHLCPSLYWRKFINSVCLVPLISFSMMLGRQFPTAVSEALAVLATLMLQWRTPFLSLLHTVPLPLNGTISSPASSSVYSLQLFCSNFFFLLLSASVLFRHW